MITNFIKYNEKYNHTQQDIIDDMRYIDEFSEKFENKFEFRIDLNIERNSQFRSYLGYGADKFYTGEIIIDNLKYYKTKRKIKYRVRIATDINPAGITGEDDIGRTYTIDFDIKQENRSRNKIPDFYGYSRNIDDIIDQFDTYVLQKLGKKKLSQEETERKIMIKKMKKYNI